MDSAAQWPPDVEAATGLCADGLVRIAQCASPSKGLGAFAAVSLRPGQVRPKRASNALPREPVGPSRGSDVACALPRTLGQVVGRYVGEVLTLGQLLCACAANARRRERPTPDVPPCGLSVPPRQRLFVLGRVRQRAIRSRRLRQPV